MLKYRGAIRKELQLLQNESWIFGNGVTMTRVVDDDEKSEMMTNGAFQNLKLLELDPFFEQRLVDDDREWKLTTLGDYMSTLRPKALPKRLSVDDLPNILQREIEAGLAAGLLKALGPNLGRALLPAVGTGFIQSKAQSLASRVATDWLLDEDGSNPNDKGGIPVPLMTLLALADTNARINSNASSVEAIQEENDSDDTVSLPLANSTAIGKMVNGEAVKGPSFVDESSIDTVPNSFVVTRDFDRAISTMERRLGYEGDYGGVASTGMKLAQEEAILQEEKSSMLKRMMSKKKGDKKLKSEEYDPHDRSLPEPVPVNPRLFPDLYLGYGEAESTHTKREILKMRLISIILNKLAANYYKQIKGASSEPLFEVKWSDESKTITTPSEFVQALIDHGHTVEVAPTSRLTTFGVGMCVKEPDGSWSNVPLGVFVESGYENKDGEMAPAMLPHSGLNMYIKGPLAGNRADGTPSELEIQHFIGIEGFCGWKSNANADVPFNEAVPAGKRLSGEDAVRATRIAGLYANILNGLATELGLPFGGYGLTAVCNDSAAIIQDILYNESTIYPLTSIGRFMQRTMCYAENLRDEMESSNESGLLNAEIEDLTAIANAMRRLPSDINAAPSNRKSAAKRMLHTLQPKLPFGLMIQAKGIMEGILEEEERHEDIMMAGGKTINGQVSAGKKRQEA